MAAAMDRTQQGPAGGDMKSSGAWQSTIGGLLSSVKNTFIEIRETHSAWPRRSHSQPASSRAKEDASSSSLPSPRQKILDEEERLLCLDCCDTESTEARSEVSEANTASTTSSPSAKLSDRAPSEEGELLRHEFRGFEPKRPLLNQEGLASYCQAEHLLELLTPQLPSRQSASCDVRPWLLPAPPSLPALPDFFVQHTGQVVMYAAAVLAASAHPAIDVHTTRDRKGWSIVAKLRPEDLLHTEQVIAWAKQAILQASEQSHCVYVMGHRRAPFRQRPHGFGAILGLMQDEHMACWDVYNTGSCRREHSCQWAHPPSVKRLYFVVRPLVAEGEDPWACFKEMENRSAQGGRRGMDYGMGGRSDAASFDFSPRSQD